MRVKLKESQGFSLLELMITLVVLGILLGIGIPSFNSITESTRLRSVVHDLYTATQLGRSAALNSRRDTIVCRANANFDACSFAADWSNGWLVASLTDVGINFELAADVTVVRQWEAVDIAINGAANGFEFNGSGRATNGNLQIQSGDNCRTLTIIGSGSASVSEVACP